MYCDNSDTTCPTKINLFTSNSSSYINITLSFHVECEKLIINEQTSSKTYYSIRKLKIKVQFACAKNTHVYIYSGVQILLGVSKWRMRTQIHTGVYLHMGKFTPGSDQMQILFLQIHMCKFTIMCHANAK